MVADTYIYMCVYIYIYTRLYVEVIAGDCPLHHIAPSPRQVSKQPLHGTPPAKSAGTIPTQLGQWAKIDEVRLSANQLNGNISSKLAGGQGFGARGPLLEGRTYVDPQGW